MRAWPCKPRVREIHRLEYEVAENTYTVRRILGLPC